MEINRNNYEAYMLDLLEGRLTAEDQQVVRDFLLLNPDLAPGIEEINPWSLEPGKISFPGKEQLKKEMPDASCMLTTSNFDLFSIARLEGDLTREQEVDHASMVEKHQEKRKEWAGWQQTKLHAEPVLFTNKEVLKRKKGISGRVIWISVISSAAVIAILLTLLRVEQPATGSELSVESEAIQNIDNEVIRAQASDPIPQQEFAAMMPKSESILSNDKPVLFSIKKNPEREEESQMNSKSNDDGIGTDTVNQFRKDEKQSKPVRIASRVTSNSDIVDEGTYDRIKHLEIPPTSIHLSSLSITQLAELDLQEVFDDYTKENAISLWSIANAGIKGINRLTGTEMSLLAARDDEGDVAGFKFKSRRFSIATPLEQSE